MKTVHVELKERSYEILIAPGLLERAPQYFQKYNIPRRLFLVANTNVFELYGAKLVDDLSSHGFKVTEIFIPDGEKFKNLHTVENIYTYLIAQRADRSSAIAALGGGVTGDIAGFVAATFLRGVRYVQIPTTLLAQVDSSVGGKTGVNHPHGKNMVGVFYQPSLVYVDTETLKTLPEREYKSGLYEVLKYGLIYDSDFLDFCEVHLDQILCREPQVLETVIGRCCEIKAEVTSIDETEADLRRILNFGHTFGHALEVITDFGKVAHGEAVAYGMLAATRLSLHLGLINQEACRRITDLIRRVGELPRVAHIPAAELVEAMQRDKKRQEDQKIFVLLRTIGQTEIRGNLDDKLICKAWQEVVSPVENSQIHRTSSGQDSARQK